MTAAEDDEFAIDQLAPKKEILVLAVAELQAFPFVRIGSRTVQGYDPKRYARLLGIDS